ncbi:cell division protein ZapE [Microbacterium mangrovi]|uniref:cell division protein ZapE n=1 Tax=Microbacterium mangrovi TaxID=1348253 RepID=UPI00068DB4AF|nr:cell division protein ZapE [Microbacterium mangrovi]
MTTITRRADAQGHPLTAAAREPFLAALDRTGATFDDAQLDAIDTMARPTRHGLYLWGPVGRGKSLLAEAYLAAVPTTRTRRVHFHEFFRDLQTQIVRRREPLERSIRHLLGDARAVLFDEFHVHDVADGVYLTATLSTILDSGILLVATSNYAPEDLMPDPLYHERFLPAIGLIRTRLETVHVGDGPDYRTIGRDRHRGFAAGTWNSDTAPEAPGTVFSFDDLCVRPHSVAQYLALTAATMTVRGVPDLSTVDREPLARFAALVDVLYDRDIPLHVHAAGEPDRITAATAPPPDVERALSRLSLLARRG